MFVAAVSPKNTPRRQPRREAPRSSMQRAPTQLYFELVEKFQSEDKSQPFEPLLAGTGA